VRRIDRRRLLKATIYWLAVVVISIGVLVGLILLLESRDTSSLSGGVVLIGR
jgi:hypothetical protein